VLRSPDFRWPATRAADWQTPWPGWVETRYEHKAVEQGRRPCYLTVFRQ
jgi:tRNA (guanine-N7-)-methyltransferase